MKITVKIDVNNRVEAIADEVGDVGFEQELYEVTPEDEAAYRDGIKTASLVDGSIVFEEVKAKRQNHGGLQPSPAGRPA
jgi:hypothetical protein